MFIKKTTVSKFMFSLLVCLLAETSVQAGSPVWTLSPDVSTQNGIKKNNLESFSDYLESGRG